MFYREKTADLQGTLKLHVRFKTENQGRIDPAMKIDMHIILYLYTVCSLVFKEGHSTIFVAHLRVYTATMGCIYLFGVLRRFQHCTGHITTGSWKGRGNQYIQFARVLYCKLPTNSKQLPAFPLKAMTGIKPRPQRWEARVLPLCHCSPLQWDVREAQVARN